MNLHQVLTGAVNPGDHCFSVGSVGEQRFTVSAGEGLEQADAWVAGPPFRLASYRAFTKTLG